MDDSTQLTLAAVLTIGGVVVSAGLITSLIALLKNVRGIGEIIERGNEPTMAFILSAVLVFVAFVSQGATTVDAAFMAFQAWLLIATSAMGIHGVSVKAGIGQ